MADQFVQLGGIGGNLGAQPVTTTGRITAARFISTEGYFTVSGAANMFVGDTSTVVGLYLDTANSIFFRGSGATQMLSLSTTAATFAVPQIVGGTASLSNKIYLGTSTSAAFICGGTNTPEGAVTAPVGSMFLRSNGGAATTLYIKESGTGNTGWVAK